MNVSFNKNTLFRQQGSQGTITLRVNCVLRQFWHSSGVPGPPRPNCRLYLRRLRQITSAPKSRRAYHKTLESVLVACSSFLLISLVYFLLYPHFRVISVGMAGCCVPLSHIFVCGRFCIVSCRPFGCKCFS